MISFSISLPDGWSKDRDWFNSHHDRKLSEWKHFEWQSAYTGWANLLTFRIDFIPYGRDHAGFGIELCLLGFWIDAKTYDTRHWDYDTNSWKVYNENTTWVEYEKQQLLDAYTMVEKDIAARNPLPEGFLTTPEGAQAVADEKARLKEERRLRGIEHRKNNQAD